MVNVTDAIERLRDGNRRFVDGVREASTGPDRRKELSATHSPFAVVLGCADSRVSPEIVFDQGLGDLFVIRVVGHIVAPLQVESVEFAVDRLGARLVVVLGHSQCGAVRATLDAVMHPAGDGNQFACVVEELRPVVERTRDALKSEDPEAVLREAVRANVRVAVDALRSGSDTLRSLIADGRIAVVGAEYALESGVVDFFVDGSA